MTCSACLRNASGLEPQGTSMVIVTTARAA